MRAHIYIYIYVYVYVYIAGTVKLREFMTSCMLFCQQAGVLLRAVTGMVSDQKKLSIHYNRTVHKPPSATYDFFTKLRRVGPALRVCVMSLGSESLLVQHPQGVLFLKKTLPALKDGSPSPYACLDLSRWPL